MEVGGRSQQLTCDSCGLGDLPQELSAPKRHAGVEGSALSAGCRMLRSGQRRAVTVELLCNDTRRDQLGPPTQAFGSGREAQTSANDVARC